MANHITIATGFWTRAAAVLLLVAPVTQAADTPQGGQVTRYARVQLEDEIFYGIVDGDRITRLEGDLFGQWEKTDKTYALEDVEVMVPTEPRTVIALAGNYRDHLGDQPLPDHPEPFLKPVSCLQKHEGEIHQPEGTEPVHHEAELVIVIGKQAKEVPEEQALDYVFGITCGNDISARAWQDNDVQWWRAKGHDTFGPCGPFIVSGLEYGKLDMELRVNGEVRQKTNTAQMIHNIPQVVSFISHYVTLEPGDLIFTGTSGKTTPLSPSDVVEVEIEGVGILRNKVVFPK